MNLQVYYLWLVTYIMGDRRKGNILFDTYYDYLKQCATYLQDKYGVIPRTIHRGVLLNPADNISEHNLWKFSHVSFSDNIQVAEAFADINSQYGQFIKLIKPNYVGHILHHKITDKDFIWFDHNWSKHLDPELHSMVTYWNQKEIIVGRDIK